MWTESPGVSRCRGETVKTLTDLCHSQSQTLMHQLKSKKWDPLWLNTSESCWKFTAISPVCLCNMLNNEICSLSLWPKDKNYQSRAEFPNEDIKQSRSLRILFSLPAESLSHSRIVLLFAAQSFHYRGIYHKVKHILQRERRDSLSSLQWCRDVWVNWAVFCSCAGIEETTSTFPSAAWNHYLCSQIWSIDWKHSIYFALPFLSVCAHLGFLKGSISVAAIMWEAAVPVLF